MSKQAMNDYINTYDNPTVEVVMRSMFEAKENFSCGDLYWVMHNQAIVFEFFRIADDNRLNNTKPKPGSWAVANDVRNKTRAREHTSNFKLNNNHISLLAHAYNTCPGRAGYFVTKTRQPLELPTGIDWEFTP